VAYATSAAGATVTYALPSAMDAVDGARPVACTPAPGSSFPLGKTTVTCTARDNSQNTATATFTAWVQVQAPSDGTFFGQPINPDGSSIFKQKSTIPVKFKLTGASAAITNLVAHLSTAKTANGVTGTFVEADSNASPDGGNTFHYDATAGQYVFNLSTKAMTAGTWSVRADLGDGVPHQISVSLK